MKQENNLEPFRSALEALNYLFQQFNQRGVIIGGIATSILGKPRFTADIDAVFLLSIDDISKLLELAQSQNIHPRISMIETFARKNRVILLRHSPSNVNIDISLGILPFEEEMVERASIRSFGNLSIRLPTAEDLIIMKAIAHRPKDLDDIRAIVLNNPDLDIERIERWIKAFAEVLETPDLWETVESILR